jgi:hypothetical protein
MSQAASADYDFFIAHAGRDKAEAERLFDLLNEHARVFLDSRCLQLGDQWDRVLKQAQRHSRMTVVMVSPRTESAFYQQEEVAAAIDLARQEGQRHRVVPVFLGGAPGQDVDVPYGLRRLHCAVVSDKFTLEDVARQLLGLLDVESPKFTTQPSESLARKALDELGRGRQFKKHVDLLRRCLSPDEELLVVCSVFYLHRMSKCSCVLAFTSRRLVWVYTHFRAREVRELAYDQIVAARAAIPSLTAVALLGKTMLVVKASDESAEFVGLPRGGADKLAALINTRFLGKR